MKVVNFDTGVITAESPEKLVEIVGRTCYKSEDKITEYSYKTFIENLILRGHFAMLEHGRITFKIMVDSLSNVAKLQMKLDSEIVLNAIPKVYLDVDWDNNIMYINVSMSHLFNPRYKDTILQAYCLSGYQGDSKIHSSILNEDISIEMLNDISNENIADTFKQQATHVTVKFICDRGVSHELVRHRFAIAQESQRYCRYGSGKFGDDISFICPTDIDEDSAEYLIWKSAISFCEQTYLKLLEVGQPPQVSRSVLPNSTKTEVILTANLLEWKHFFDMRLRGTTGKPHPDMIHVAEIAHESIKEVLKYEL